MMINNSQQQGPAYYQYSRFLRVDKEGNGDHVTVKEACDHAALFSLSAANFVVIEVNAGTYTEEAFVIPSWVVVKGVASEQDRWPATLLVFEPIAADTVFITASANSSIANCSIVTTNEPPNFATSFAMINAGDAVELSQCYFQAGGTYNGANTFRIIDASTATSVGLTIHDCTILANGTGITHIEGDTLNVKYCEARGYPGTGISVAQNGKLELQFTSLAEKEVINFQPSGDYVFADTGSEVILTSSRVPVAKRGGTGTFIELHPTLRQLTYIPTTPADWVDPDPVNVQEGLDKLAGVLGSPTHGHEMWTFTTPSGTSGTFYVGGYYIFNSTHNDFSPVVNFGVANNSYAAHFMIVVGAVPVDTVTITITGTSINDDGVRVDPDTQDIVLTTSNLVGDYLETSKKWLGLITVEAVSGTPVNCNYGFSKYFDNGNEDYTIIGCEATWRGGAADAGANIILHHHTATGWTYNAGAEPTPPTPLASMVADHVTESAITNNVEGAWKRANLSTLVLGSASEGTILEIVTTASRTFEIGNFSLHFTEDD